LFERKSAEFAGIQFTKHFIEFVPVETNQIFRWEFQNDLGAANLRPLLEQGCRNQTPSASFQFFQIWDLFLTSKCRGKYELGLCMTSVLAKRMRVRSADFRRILRPNTFLNEKSVLCGHILLASTEITRRPRFYFPLHIDIENTYQIRMENKMLALGVYFLMEAEIQQPWLSMDCNAYLARCMYGVPNPLFSMVY